MQRLSKLRSLTVEKTTMIALEPSFYIPRPLGRALIAATAGAVLFQYYIRPILYNEGAFKSTVVARTRTDLEVSLSLNETSPYPHDVFPGGRDVMTPYGTIKVFEWGPDTGDKVVLMHGIGTPCIALGDMAKSLVDRGCRVMLFDFFGRGYSDAPADLPYDDRLYTTQLLLVLASSPLCWTGDSAFHLVGYSLGGAIAACFAAYFPHMLRSLNLVCPGGLIRSSRVSLKSRLLYSGGLLPDWLTHRLVRSRLEPQHNGPSADVPVDQYGDDDSETALDFDSVTISKDVPSVKVGDVMRWQLRGNPGLVGAYVSTIRHAPVYNQHNKVWKLLSKVLEDRRPQTDGSTLPPGLPGGKVCLVLALHDPLMVKDEWIEDSKAVLGEDAVDIHVIPGGHDIAISKGTRVAKCMVESWER